jgi:hypothetical protein
MRQCCKSLDCWRAGPVAGGDEMVGLSQLRFAAGVCVVAAGLLMVAGGAVVPNSPTCPAYRYIKGTSWVVERNDQDLSVLIALCPDLRHQRLRRACIDLLVLTSGAQLRSQVVGVSGGEFVGGLVDHDLERNRQREELHRTHRRTDRQRDQHTRRSNHDQWDRRRRSPAAPDTPSKAVSPHSLPVLQDRRGEVQCTHRASAVVPVLPTTKHLSGSAAQPQPPLDADQAAPRLTDEGQRGRPPPTICTLGQPVARLPRRHVGGMRQAHRQHEPPAVAGLGVTARTPCGLAIRISSTRRRRA